LLRNTEFITPPAMTRNLVTVCACDWSELSALALYYGKSRCWLFTFLLLLDLVGVGELLSEAFYGVPSLGSSVLFTGTFLQRGKGFFTREMRVKRNNFNETIREKPKLFERKLE
jgi:Protein of unknown function (DUF1564)